MEFTVMIKIEAKTMKEAILKIPDDLEIVGVGQKKPSPQTDPKESAQSLGL
jgi:hypothetical protein